MTGDLDGRVAIVTGAGSGIGEACAKTIAERGGSVLVSDQRLDAAERVAAEIESKGDRAIADRTDVSDPDAVRAMVERAVERSGRLDIGVNNAGIGSPAAPTGEYPLDGWRMVMSVNLDGVFYCTRAEISAMKQTGQEVAELVVWLASDASSFVTGSDYPIDGGYLAR